MVLDHGWRLNPGEAAALQRELAPRVVLADDYEPPQRVAGVDVGFREGGKTTRAALAVLSLSGLETVETAVAECPTSFPYIPGLLSFREIPAVLQALSKLTVSPDLLLCDGQGLAHPRRFGLACHLGVLTDIPSIGVAKSRLIGVHDGPPKEKGQWVPLMDKGETIGAVVCTRNNVSPVYVSLGHRISLPTAIDYVLGCTTRFRLPETTRWAHRLASA